MPEISISLTPSEVARFEAVESHMSCMSGAFKSHLSSQIRSAALIWLDRCEYNIASSKARNDSLCDRCGIRMGSHIPGAGADGAGLLCPTKE